MPINQSLYMVRPYEETDKAFIMATALRGLYYGDSWFSKIPKDIFMDNYKLVLENLIAKRSATIAVACLTEDPDVILGYSILSGDLQTIDFVYVKKAWREQGIARKLTPAHPRYVSHLTEMGTKLLTKLNGAVFNPFAF